MGHSQADKAATHERIIRIAARLFREDGLDGLSVANIMKAAELTHGGFYKHFESRDQLVSEALAFALQQGRQPRGDPDSNKPKASLESVLKNYLSEAHRDELGTACAVGALVSDVARANEDAKDLYTAQVKKNLDSLEYLIASEDENGRMKAMVAYSAMIGAVGLSRAVSDEKLSGELLKLVRKYLVTEFG
ncbi:TetR/AcrR family transcriptional regulator [Undibacterium sp. TJN25]|uniref:TetR/AcrR family transcriptional regulator n=1 Tax=Undibacterium sp. TJN25 TaxID=3413056 RepID=UPI003BF1BB65